jgi:acyl carrier protein
MSFNKIAEIIAKTARVNVDEVTPESNLVDLGLTSLDTITLLFELEEAFDVEIPNEIIPSIITVRDIVEKLDENIAEA